MSAPDDRPALAELTEPEPPTGSERYLAWAERKIRNSIAEDEAHPEKRAPLSLVKKLYGAR